MKIERTGSEKSDKKISFPKNIDPKLKVLKQQVQHGTYKIDSTKLIQRIIESGLLDE